MPYSVKPQFIAGAAAVAVWHSFENLGFAGHEADFGAMAMSWAGVTEKAVPEEGAESGEAAGAARERVGRRAASAVRVVMVMNIFAIYLVAVVELETR